MQNQPEILPTITFRLGPGFWAEVPTRYHSDLIDQVVRRAKTVLDEYEIALPETTVFQRICMAAMEATVLLFQAADHDPSNAELQAFFEHFVLWAVTGEGHHAQASI